MRPQCLWCKSIVASEIDLSRNCEKLRKVFSAIMLKHIIYAYIEVIVLAVETKTIARPIRTVAGKSFLRIPIHTHVIMPGEDLAEVAWRYCHSLLEPGDIVFISSKAASGAQGRFVPVEEIKPSWLAKFLASKVKKVTYGVGLGTPETMEMAIREVGALRCLLGAMVHAITRLFGRSGDFYRVTGWKTAVIDHGWDDSLPEYCHKVILGPKDPDTTCEVISKRIGAGVCLVDVNDIGGSNVLGASAGIDRRLVEDAIRDNPLGQGLEQTPIGILRQVEAERLTG